MGYSGVSQDNIANVEILNAKLRKESWYNTFWSKFSGFVDISKDDNGNKLKRPSGNPIEILKEFEQGRDNMLLPLQKDLTGDPVYGDTVVAGTGNSLDYNWLRIYVNQYRKAAVPQKGRMSRQRIKFLQRYRNTLPALKKWVSKWENQSVMQAFYEGISPNLSAGTDDDGLGLAKRYHPNWYINDGGTLTTIGSENTLKTNAQLDAALIDAGTCDDCIDMAILRDLRVKCMELMIPQMETKEGHKFWVLILHPDQVNNLKKDSTFQSAINSAYQKKIISHPQFSGAIAVVEGFAIYEDLIMIRSWDDADASFFGSTWAERMANSSGAVKNALVLGNQAMGKGIAEPMGTTLEKSDHNNVIEMATYAIDGYNRADFFDEDDALESSGDAFYKNQSSGHVAAELSAYNRSSLIFSTDTAGD